MYLGWVVESGPADAGLRRAAAPLHTGAARLPAQHGPGPAGRAGADRRRPAVPRQPAVGLPLPHALPACGGRLRGDGAARPAGEAAPGGLPHAARRAPATAREAAGAEHGPWRGWTGCTSGSAPGDASHAVRGVSLHVMPGEVAVPARRERLRQVGDHAGADAAAAAAPRIEGGSPGGRPGRRRMAGPALRGLRGGVVAMVFQEPMTALDPVYTVGPADRRDGAAPHAACRARRPARGRWRCWSWCACPTPRGGWRPIRTSCRRAAAAGGDRDGAVLPPAAAAGGRADHGAGRDRADPDPGAAARAAAGAGHGHGHRDPRPGRRGGGRGPGGGDVCRADRGAGERARRAAHPAAPVHARRCWPRWCGRAAWTSRRSPGRRRTCGARRRAAPSHPAARWRSRPAWPRSRPSARWGRAARRGASGWANAWPPSTAAFRRS